MTTKPVFLYLCIVFAESLAQQINTPDGPIQGVMETTNSGRSYYAYYSLRYANPPTGSRRFLAPEQVTPWTELYNATTQKPNICYQLYFDNDAENEDCLFLSVFTPQDPMEACRNLPVMINFHWGGFAMGSGMGFSPKYLLEYDVIFITFNSRLGVFGFLSTGDDVIPGNAGLKDQIEALRWVQRNIAAFGGDPNKVTLTGQSSGAASVGYLILSPSASGLFSAAILESGSSLCPWAYQRNQREISFKTGAYINAKFNCSRDSQALLSELQNAPAADVDHAALQYTEWDSLQPDFIGRITTQQGYYFAPVVEAVNDDAVLTQYQYEAFESGNFNRVPILIGICSEDGLLNLYSDLNSTLQGYDSEPTYMNPQDLHINSERVWQQVGQLLKQRYSPDSTFMNNKLGAIRYFTEQNFLKSITNHAELQSKGSDVYFYQFSFTGTMAGNTASKLEGSGNVTHDEETNYIFSGNPLEGYTASDIVVHNRLVKLWTNFAIYHNPTPFPENLLQYLTWPKVHSKRFQYVNIGNFNQTDLKIVQGKPRSESMRFWDDLYTTYGTRPFDTY